MADNKEYRRSTVIAPKTTAQFNQFLPTRDKQSGYVPAPLRKKRSDYTSNEEYRRSWASPQFTEADGSFSRNTSLSDIPTEEVRKKVNYEELQKMRERVKENEDKWQDDLTKWKNRRRSVNSDIMKKKEERDQIESLTSGNNTRKSKTFKEMEEERGNRESGYKGRFDTFSTSEDVFEEPSPKARTLDRSSFTFDYSYSSGSRSKMHSLPSLADEEPTAGSLPSDEVDSPSRPVQSSTENMLNRSKVNPTISSTSRSLLDDPIPSSVTSKPSLPERSSTIESRSTRTTVSSSTMETNDNSKPIIKDSNSITPVPVPRLSYGRLEEDQTRTSLSKPDAAETKQPVVSRVSASLPKSYQRSDSARITSVVAPRPFGTQSTRISSLPRTYMMEDKRVNGETENTKTTTVPSRYAEFMKADEASSQTGSVQSSNDDDDEEEENQMLSAPGVFSSVTPVGRVSPQTKVFPVDNTQEESYSDMRISLNQKPKSSQDFGFQSNWDSTGAYIKSIKPGSPAELCHLKVGDEILAVNGHKVADMSYDQWKNCMGEALQQGSLLMDVRRYGKNSFPEPHVNTSLDFSSHSAMDSSMKTLNVSSQPANNLASIGMNGGIRDEPVTLRKKESEPISLKNLKRRSEFFEQGGSENTVSDVPIPSPVTPSNRWSWDPEEERRRQEKWQKEQDRQLQEKYKRDQEKLEEEFRKAQEEAVKEGTKQYQEELRKLEVEASRQALREEEERKMREEERKRREEQQKRMEEERKKKEEEDRRQKEEEKRREEEERRRQEAQHRLQSNGVDYANTFPELSYSHRVKSKSTPELDEMERTDIKGVYSRHRGLASWLLEEELRRKKDPHILKQQAASELELERRRLLSAMKYRNPERASSSSLSDGTWMKDNQYKKELTSPAEADRQQIIQDMKKKTSLQTDNSWIRQSSTTSSMTKEHVSLPMRRGESLDNLDTNRPSWGSSWTQSSTSSIPDYSRPQSSSFGPSYRGGQTGIVGKPGFQSQDSLRPSLQPTSTLGNASTASDNASSRNRSVSGKKICTFCELPLGKGAAMIIESLGLCFHLQCFKCIQCKRDLGGSENGAEVRIRNKQLFCNSCYMRVKTGQPTAM